MHPHSLSPVMQIYHKLWYGLRTIKSVKSDDKPHVNEVFTNPVTCWNLLQRFLCTAGKKPMPLFLDRNAKD